MASPLYDLDDEVGRLIFSWTGRPDSRPSRSVMPEDEFDIGRQNFIDAFRIKEHTISTHHLRFRCVVFNDETDEYVAPMVYARILSSNAIQLIRHNSPWDDAGVTVQSTDQDVLLEHGDRIHLTPQMSLTFAATRPSDCRINGLDSIQTAEAQRFRDQLVLRDRKLGSGGNASVFFAQKQSNGELVACKVVPLPYTQVSKARRIHKNQKLTKLERDHELEKIEKRLMDEREHLFREFNVLQDLDHPNIIRLEKVVCGTYNLYIFQELIQGGDLMSYLERRGALGEAQTAIIIYQLLKAVNYLHSNGVVHRDIKPENILMADSRDGARIVLTDFGQSRTIGDAKAVKSRAVFRMQTKVGTYGYAAPEIFEQIRGDLHQKGYREVIDIWSVGCITATLLTSQLIFPGNEDQYDEVRNARTVEELKELWDSSIIEHGPAWTDVKSAPKKFIRDCLVVDESQRMNAKEALGHPWLTNRNYAAMLEKLYQQAIEHWNPRQKSQDLVEFIDTTNVVPTESRPEHVKRLAEEVKSRHFQNLPSAPSLMALFGPSPTKTALPKKRKRTPLPQICDDASADTVEVPASPSVTQLRSILASPLRPLDATQVSNVRRRDSVVHCSIEDYAPPSIGPSARPSGNRHVSYVDDSPTQSQMLLGDFSGPDSGLEDGRQT